MMKLTKIASAAALVAAALSPGLAQADAVGQGILDITNFSLRVGNGNNTISGTSLLGSGTATVINAGSTGDTKATLNGTTTNAIANDLTEFPIRSCVGACPAAVVTPITGAPTTTFAQSYSSIIGNALTGTARAIADNTVSLAPSGSGSAQGNSELGADFTINLLQAATIEVNFNADAFIRAYLSSTPGNARGSYNWGFNIVSEATGATVFSWSPDGQAGGISAGGTEYFDPFDLTDARTRNTAGNFTLDADALAGANQFQAETGRLAIGTYTLTVTHETFGDATLVPEPEMLSLVGLALFGAAFASRRRQAK